ADTATARSGKRGRTSWINVPFPAPEGPVTTKTGLAAGALPGPLPVVEEGNQLVPLAVGEAADRLRLADAALVKQARGLHAPELRDRHQHVEHLGGRDVLGRLTENLLNGDGPRLQVLLQLRALHANVVRALQSLHPLVQRTDRSLDLCLGGHHEGRTLPTSQPRATATFWPSLPSGQRRPRRCRAHRPDERSRLASLPLRAPHERARERPGRRRARCPAQR